MDKDLTIALLIDGDNLHNFYQDLIERLKEYGHISISRVYADFSKQLIDDKKKDNLLDLGITPIHHFAYTKGKNSTDSKITIDAMDILYTGRVNCLCLATNDSDFTTLATRFKEANCMVIGASESNRIPKPLKSVCDRYILLGEKEVEIETIKGEKTSDVLTKNNLIKFAKDTINANKEEDGYMDFAFLVNEIYKKYNEFDPRNFGVKANKALPLFQTFKQFNLKKEGLVYQIRNSIK